MSFTKIDAASLYTYPLLHNHLFVISSTQWCLTDQDKLSQAISCYPRIQREPGHQFHIPVLAAACHGLKVLRQVGGRYIIGLKIVFPKMAISGPNPWT